MGAWSTQAQLLPDASETAAVRLHRAGNIAGRGKREGDKIMCGFARDVFWCPKHNDEFEKSEMSAI